MGLPLAEDELPPLPGDAELFAAARSGSNAALGSLLEQCQNYRLLVAHRELGGALRGKAGASDIVQETFLEAQRDFGGFDGASHAEFRRWLRKLMLNNLANFARRYRGTTKRDIRRETALNGAADSANPFLLRAPGPSPSMAMMADEEQERVLAALAQLPEHYRRAIELRHRDGLGYAEIGAELRRTPEAARKLWARAVETLQALLENDRAVSLAE